MPHGGFSVGSAKGFFQYQPEGANLVALKFSPPDAVFKRDGSAKTLFFCFFQGQKALATMVIEGNGVHINN
jgi:hypothetical protein